MPLVLRSVFPEPPNAEQVADFRRHVRETGHPETWPLISTTPPPSIGDVRMLAQGIEINSKRRADGGRAPCPICLPAGWKWLHDGALIWCAETSAAYCIGPDCSSGDLRLKVAVARNELTRSERRLREIERLTALVAAAAGWRSWVRFNRPLAVSTDPRHRSFAGSLPKLRRSLALALKGDAPAALLAISGGVEVYFGRAFLAGGWTLARDLDHADEAFSELVAAGGPDPERWATGMADDVRAAWLKKAETAVRSVGRTHDRLMAASHFLSPVSIGALARWSSAEDAPTVFSVQHTPTQALFRHREEFCRVPLGAARPTPLPAHVQADAA